MLWQRTLEYLLYPPGNLIIFLLLAALLSLWQKNWGKWLLILGVVQVLIFSLPAVSEQLFLQLRLQNLAQTNLWEKQKPDAIVVLGAARNIRAREFPNQETSSGVGIERLRYAALLHRHTQLPILITGGSPYGDAISEAALMARTLEEEFNTPVKWLEEGSHTTWENAELSDKMLHEAGIQSAWLVTQEWHMPRALLAFQNRQVNYLSASTSFSIGMPWGSSWFRWLPQAAALQRSNVYLHEWLGLLWYNLKKKNTKPPYIRQN